jgi:hypothetical protein
VLLIVWQQQLQQDAYSFSASLQLLLLISLMLLSLVCAIADVLRGNQ